MEGDLRGTFADRLQAAISIHALRVEGDHLPCPLGVRLVISIHALRVEGDAANFTCSQGACSISIHALRVEGDQRNGANARS